MIILSSLNWGKLSPSDAGIHQSFTGFKFVNRGKSSRESLLENPTEQKGKVRDLFTIPVPFTSLLLSQELFFVRW